MASLVDYGCALTDGERGTHPASFKARELFSLSIQAAHGDARERGTAYDSDTNQQQSAPGASSSHARVGRDDVSNVDEEKKPRKTRPKLTYEKLTHKSGIPDVFGSFRPLFKKQRRRGRHVTTDLGRLLDMYEMWQQRIFPSCEFDVFVERIQRMYGKPGGRGEKGATLKGDMRELREKVVELALERISTTPTDATCNEHAAAPTFSEHNQLDSFHEPATCATLQHTSGPSTPPAEVHGDADANDDDDDELLQLHQEEQNAPADCWQAEDDVLDDMLM